MIHEPLKEVGLDALVWTPAAVQQYFDETYNVEYAIPSRRRLVKEAGVSYQKPLHTAAELDTEEQKMFREELKKWQEMDATVGCIDQTKKSLQVEPCALWFPRDTRPSVKFSGQRD